MSRSFLFKGLSITLMIIGWIVLSNVFDNTMILPKISDVIITMKNQATSTAFYQSVFVTLLRMLVAIILSITLGTGLGVLSALNKSVHDFLYPITTMIKTIPNISYMILVLLWFSSSVSVIVIVSLVIFPLFYEATITGVKSLRRSLSDVLALYSETPFNKLTKVYIPAMSPFVMSNLSIAVNLGFKVAIMAEVLGQPFQGIGKEMLLSKLTLNSTSIFAWTSWIIIIGILLNNLVLSGIRIINRRYSGDENT